MTRLLAAAAVVSATVALAAPAGADERLLRHGVVEGTAGYTGCVVTSPGSGAAARWCLVAQRDASGVRLLVVSLDDRSVSLATAHDAAALEPGTALGRSVLRLRLAAHPLLGDVDVTFYAEATLTDLVVNDACVPLPLHLELTAPGKSMSFVYGTSGTVAGSPVSGYDRCGAAVSVGPFWGRWRMTVA